MRQVSPPYLYEGHQKAQTGGKPKGSCSSVAAQQILPGLLPEPWAQEDHIAEGQVVQTLCRVMDGISFNMPTAATMFFHERFQHWGHMYRRLFHVCFGGHSDTAYAFVADRKVYSWRSASRNP